MGKAPERSGFADSMSKTIIEDLREKRTGSTIFLHHFQVPISFFNQAPLVTRPRKKNILYIKFRQKDLSKLGKHLSMENIKHYLVPPEGKLASVAPFLG